MKKDRRDGFIPARKAELIAAMKAEAALAPADEAGFSDLARLLAAVFHYESYDALEALKTLYAPLDPDAPGAQSDAAAGVYGAFETAFVEALTKGNYTEIAPDTAVSARAARKLTGLSIKTSQAGIRATRFFGRGAHQEAVTRRTWLGLRRETIDTISYSEVVVLVAFKSQDEIAREDRKGFAEMRRGVRPSAVLIKHFRNVAHAELMTLHPGAKPTMQARDQMFLAAPALVGGVPIAMQIVPTISVLFAVIALYFGTRGAIDNSALQRALAAVSGLVAVGAFVMRQWMKYERQTLKYQKQLADTVYFRNLANNAGVLDSLIGAGEAQDLKEALLAYWMLLAAKQPLTRAEIDARIEAFLKRTLSLDIDFEIGDALAKLVRLGLVSAQGETFAAVPLRDALAKLDEAWDSYFKFGRTPQPASA